MWVCVSELNSREAAPLALPGQPLRDLAASMIGAGVSRCRPGLSWLGRDHERLGGIIDRRRNGRGSQMSVAPDEADADRPWLARLLLEHHSCSTWHPKRHISIYHAAFSILTTSGNARMDSHHGDNSALL